MSTVLTSIHGKLVGLDKGQYLTSPKGAKLPALYLGTSNSEVQVDIEGATTVTEASTASNITARGITTLGSTGAKDFFIADPVAGVRKTLTTTTTSTAVKTVTRGTTGFTFSSTDGSTMVKISMAGGGNAVELIGLSTSLYGVINRVGSTATTMTGTS